MYMDLITYSINVRSKWDTWI